MFSCFSMYFSSPATRIFHSVFVLLFFCAPFEAGGSVPAHAVP